MQYSTTRLPFACLTLTVWVAGLTAAQTCDPDNGGITLPAGFCGLLAGDGLGTARHMAVAPNGDVFAALRGDAEMGGVVALRDTAWRREVRHEGALRPKKFDGDRPAQRIPLRRGPPHRPALYDQGSPAAGDAVTVGYPPGPGKVSMMTGIASNGRFTLPQVAPGTYRLYAWDDLDTAQHHDPEFLKAWESNSPLITVRENAREEVTLK